MHVMHLTYYIIILSPSYHGLQYGKEESNHSSVGHDFRDEGHDDSDYESDDPRVQICKTYQLIAHKI